MRKSFTSVATLLALAALLLLPRSLSASCGGGGGGQLSATVTNLPEIDFSGFQVLGLNNAGELTGFFYVAFDHPPHVFAYNQGQLTDLGTLGGDMGQGNAINASGQIAGESQPLGSLTSHAFFYDRTNLVDLGTLDGSSSRATAINDNGQAAGSSLTAGDAATHGFLSANGTMTDLGDLGGGYSTAAALNSAGTVVGQSTLANGQLHAFSYSHGVMQDIGTLGAGQYSSAFSINASGVIAGESSINDFEIHPFVYANGVMSDVGTLGGSYATAYTINNPGQVMGLSSLPGDAIYHGYVSSNGVITDLGTLGGDYTFPYAQNNLGQVVGQSDTTTDGSHAFLWQNGVMTDLNSLVDTNSGWRLDLAIYINDTGRIVGIGEHNGLSEWFILDVSSGGNNNPPVAVVGPDQVVHCHTTVVLDGSESHDPDGDALTFEWSSGGLVLGTNATLSGTFSYGVNLVTLKVTDPCGASDHKSVTVTVVDTNGPTISPLAPVTLSADVQCQAALPNLLSQVTVTDNCTPAEAITLSQSPAAGSVLAVGQHSVTITAGDLSSNSSSLTVLVTVADTTPPVIVSGPALAPVPAAENCQGLTPAVTAQIEATDNCTPAAALVITQDPAAGTPAGLGQHLIIVMVKDASGNQVKGCLRFTVVDKTAPLITSAPATVTVSVDSNCQAVIPDVLAGVTASDNCTPANQLTKAQTPAAGTLVSKGTYTLTVNVTDAAGNASTRQILLNVVDTTAPVIVAVPSSVTVSVDSNCQALVPNVLGDVTVTDNCTPANLVVKSQSPAAGTVVGKGTYTLTVTATDADGNPSSRQVTLNVVDTTAPVITSVPSSVTVAVDANCEGTVPNILASVVAGDNCTPMSQLLMTQSPAAGTALGKGTYPVTVSVADASGNVSTRQLLLNLVDTTAPVISSVTASPNVISPPNHQMVPVTVSVSATDNCDAPVNKIVSITCNESISPEEARITGNLTASLAASRNSSGTGRIYTLTVRSSDSCGNSSTRTVTVTVPKGSK
jgi:probable HAF family extracellular repeat protein